MIKSLKKALTLIAGAGLLMVSQASSALLLVEQYNGYWSSNVNDLANYAANNTATASGLYGIIDFTDDPNGFAGSIPGSNRWPSAEAANVDGTGHSLNNTFFAHITGDFYVGTDDTYYFQTWNDDGVFVYVDGILVINDPTLHPEMRFEGSTFLSAGNHSVELFFFENGGEASLEFTLADSNRVFSHFNDPQGPATLTTVPEPGTLALIGLGLLGFARTRKR